MTNTTVYVILIIMKTKKKSEHYVNNADFLEAMKGYRKEVNKAIKDKKDKPLVGNYIGSCFLNITLQPGEDREFKNQFKEYLQKNMRMDEPVKKEKPKVKKKKKVKSSKFFA